MFLYEWLKKHEKTPEWLAEKIGCTEKAVNHYLRGARRPNYKMIDAIEEITNCEVMRKDMTLPYELREEMGMTLTEMREELKSRVRRSKQILHGKPPSHGEASA